ncbi:MAG: protein-export chaperone SecB [Bacteroidota bacterium]|jgi:preprotein translocase subunit SecB
MAEPLGNVAAGGNGKPAEAAAAVQIRVLGQYVKDLSFENPNVTKLLAGAPENPNLSLEINVNATKVSADVYESAISFNAKATSKVGVIYEFEMVYAGLFKIENIPPPALEPMLLVNCPMLLFPFLRRIVADLTREAGFPPLLLDPVDFGALYVRKKEQAAAGGPPRTVS